MNDLPVDRLGNYPLLQFAAAVIVLAGLAFAVYRGSRDRRSPEATFNDQRYFFDGPIGEALKLLRDGRNLLNEIREHVEPNGELLRNVNRELSEIRQQLDDIRALKTVARRRRL